MGGGTFSLEGRPAAGLYLVAWILSGFGLALMVVAGMAGPPVVGVLLVVGLVVLNLGLASAAGYQLVARASRPPTAYRGPAPLILFALQLALASLVELILLGLGLLRDPRDNPLAFLVAAVAILACYLVVVWVFVVRPRALSWREIAQPSDQVSRTSRLSDVAVGAGTMLLAWPIVTAIAALLATLLQTTTPEVVPPTGTPLELLITALAAAALFPIGEEIFFRGFALSAWLRDLGPRSALIRSTAFFALVHGLNVLVAPEPGAAFEGLKQALLIVAAIVPLGAVLGWLYLRRGLAAAIAGHVTFNLINVILLAIAQQAAPTL